MTDLESRSRLARIEAKLDILLGKKLRPVIPCTPQQADVLRAFHELSQELGRSPTQAEVGDRIHRSHQGISGHCKRLEALGLMRKNGPGKHGWEVTDRAWPVLVAGAQDDSEGVA